MEGGSAVIRKVNTGWREGQLLLGRVSTGWREGQLLSGRSTLGGGRVSCYQVGQHWVEGGSAVIR